MDLFKSEFRERDMSTVDSRASSTHVNRLVTLTTSLRGANWTGSTMNVTVSLGGSGRVSEIRFPLARDPRVRGYSVARTVRGTGFKKSSVAVPTFVEALEALRDSASDSTGSTSVSISRDDKDRLKDNSVSWDGVVEEIRSIVDECRKEAGGT